MKTKYIISIQRLIIFSGALLLVPSCAGIIMSSFRQFCYVSSVTNNKDPLPNGTIIGGLDYSGLVPLTNAEESPVVQPGPAKNFWEESPVLEPKRIVPTKVEFENQLTYTARTLRDNLFFAEVGLILVIFGIFLTIKGESFSMYNIFKTAAIFLTPLTLTSVLIVYYSTYFYAFQSPINEFVKVFKDQEWQNLYTEIISKEYIPLSTNIFAAVFLSLFLSGIAWVSLPLLKKTDATSI